MRQFQYATTESAYRLDSLGRSVIIGETKAPPCLVVGVAKDVRSREASLYQRGAEPLVYVPAYAPIAETAGVSLALVRTRGPASFFLPEIRATFLRLPVPRRRGGGRRRC